MLHPRGLQLFLPLQQVRMSLWPELVILGKSEDACFAVDDLIAQFASLCECAMHFHAPLVRNCEALSRV